jgi:hypothetical protein
VGRCGRSERHATGRPRCSRCLAASPRSAPAYGWPVRPFHAQHPVRGHFGDPRIGPGAGGIVRTLHFGVDVSAPDGTPVYATTGGSVSIHPLHADTVLVTRADGTVFEYWHVVPAVRAGTRAVAYRTVLGHVGRGWGHVHFSERSAGGYVNPLRPHAMGPYADASCPTAGELRAERHGRRVGRRALRGIVDLVVAAYDTPAMSAPRPWAGLPVTPALVRWRLVNAQGRPVFPWRAAYDVRRALPSASWEAVYAPGTRQNRPNRAGRYRFYLVRGLDADALAGGSYAVQVLVSDTAGNRVRSSTPLEVGA